MVIEIKHYQLKNILIELNHKPNQDIINDLNKFDTLKIQLTINLFLLKTVIKSV